MPGALDLRQATSADAEAIRAIYNLEVLDSTITFDLVARTLDEQKQWIDEHSGAHPAIVALADGSIVGFGSLSPYRDRPGYRTTVEDSVYVHRDHRGSGIGHALLAELVRLAEAHGFHAMMARIVDGHTASIQLHTSLGFELVGVEREVGRKFGTWLDVALMQLLF
ncbi:MAG: GNAT family N-acetyltransferase [Acidimicrobiales bacterium]